MPQSRKNPKRRVVPAEPRRNRQETIPEWGERMRRSGRPLPLILLAQLMAVAQPDVTELVDAALSGKIQRKFPPILLEERRAYYRNSKRMWSDLIETFRPVLPGYFLDGLQFARCVQIGPKIWNRLSEDERTELCESLNSALGNADILSELTESVEIFWQTTRAEHLQFILSVTGQEWTDEMLFAPCTQFLLCVFLPCMVCYGKSPGELFREAAEGNTSALCNLLRIDKQAMFLQEIIEVQQKFLYEKNQTVLSAMSAALKGKPLEKRSPRLMKFGIIKFLQSISESIPELFRSPRMEFTSTDFADLFDCVSAITKEPLKDCLPADIGTFRKGLRRAKVNMGGEGWDIFS